MAQTTGDAGYVIPASLKPKKATVVRKGRIIHRTKRRGVVTTAISRKSR
jgi:hypothetical protein